MSRVDSTRSMRSFGTVNAAHGLAFGEDEVLLDEVVQRGKFLLAEIILGDGDILLAYFRAAPVGQAMWGFAASARL